MTEKWNERQIGISGRYKGSTESAEAYQARLVWIEDPLGTSLHELADKFSVSYDTITRWKSNFDWHSTYVEYRKEFRRQQKTGKFQIGHSNSILCYIYNFI